MAKDTSSTTQAAPDKITVTGPDKWIAKTDFVICQNDFYLEIKAGDDLSKIPECRDRYLANLKAEGIL